MLGLLYPSSATCGNASQKRQILATREGVPFFFWRGLDHALSFACAAAFAYAVVCASGFAFAFAAAFAFAYAFAFAFAFACVCACARAFVIAFAFCFCLYLYICLCVHSDPPMRWAVYRFGSNLGAQAHPCQKRFACGVGVKFDAEKKKAETNSREGGSVGGPDVDLGVQTHPCKRGYAGRSWSKWVVWACHDFANAVCVYVCVCSARVK